MRRLLIETDSRTFEVRLRRGRQTAPDRFRWRVTVRPLSGPDLTEEEAAGLVKRVVAELVSQGYDVVRWGTG